MPRDPRFEEIRPRTRSLGRSIVHLAEATSTMDVARDRAVEGAPEGLVVVADEQTAGVGRHGRTWHSPKGGLWATIILRPGTPGAALLPLPLAAGVAMAQAIRTVVRVDVRLKWPNDLLVRGRKVGGLLVEGRYAGDRPDFLLMGLGVNGDQRPESFPADVRDSATSLSIEAGRHVCLPALLKGFLERFEPAYDSLRAGRSATIIEEARARMDTLGREVRVGTAHGRVEGRAMGLGENGELLVESSSGVVRITAGECENLRETD